MKSKSGFRQLGENHQQFAVSLLGLLVSVHGLYIVAATLIAQLRLHHKITHLSAAVVDLPLFIGVSLVYLGAILRRRKRTAWWVAVLAYTFYLGASMTQFVHRGHFYNFESRDLLIRILVVPIVVLGLLFVLREKFVVKSDIRGFGFAARISVAVLVLAFVYGASGFMLMDKTDFHQEIGFPSAIHYTLDQFDLTTAKPLTPYTERAHLFVESLSFVSVAALVYAAISLFQPLRSRLSHQSSEREKMEALLNQYGALSEEFFKIWPHDKHYYFDPSGQSGLAYTTKGGVALCMSDVVGSKKRFPLLLEEFNDVCFGNDWLPAFIHITGDYRKLYEQHGFTIQKLGQEAVLDLNHFQTNVRGNKYFRQIRNRFEKQNYSFEVLTPPHHQAVIDRLKAISDEWLKQPGRVERGFVMGYFDQEYMQACKLAVARDAAGTIQCFMNLIPADFDKKEADYDLLRNSSKSLGNIVDYLLMNTTGYLIEEGYTRLNMGLCPLSGLDKGPDEESNRLVSGLLSFAYANGDRFFSFQGLHRFKAKYEPEWRDRYVAYKGGAKGFTKTMTSLLRAMNV